MSPTDPINANEYLASLHTLRPAEEYHEDFGTVLWWHLPIQEPPRVGSPLDTDWCQGMWCGQTPADYYTHWSPLPNARMFRTSNGVSVSDRNDTLQLPMLNRDQEEEVTRLRAKVSELIQEIETSQFIVEERTHAIAIVSAENKTLRAALEKYGAHLPTCAQINNKSGNFAGLCFTENCDCGFENLEVESHRPGPADAICKEFKKSC